MEKMTQAELTDRIRYLEMKVQALKQRHIEFLEREPTGGISSHSGDLHDRLEAERERAELLARDLADLTQHRDDVVRQIEHQHEHILYLTDKINQLERSHGNPVRALMRSAGWLLEKLGAKGREG